MIETAATPTASPLGSALGVGSPAGALATANGGKSGDPTDFANLLSADEAAAPGEPIAQATAAPNRQLLAALPAPVVATGKILPPVLVVTDTVETPAATPAGPPVAVLPLLRAVRPLEVGQPTRTRAPAAQASEATAPADDTTETAPVSLTTIVFTLTPVAAQAEPAAAAANSVPGATPAQAAPSALPLIPAIAAQINGQALPRATEQPTSKSAEADDARTLRVPAAATAAVAQAQFTLAGPAAPSAPASLRLRPVVDAKAAPVAETSMSSALPATVADAAPAVPNSVPVSASPNALPGLGHSFAAVVDRLMAARDAVQADGAVQPVAINLRHADFGTVSVRFEQRADGLSVALASPDPDFARAVQAAAPASSGGDAGLTGNGQGTGHSSPGTTGSTGSGAQGQPGQRGATANQPERFAAPAPNPRSTPAPATTDTAPRGIYA